MGKQRSRGTTGTGPRGGKLDGAGEDAGVPCQEISREHLELIELEAKLPLEAIEKQWWEQMSHRRAALKKLQQERMTSAARFFEKAALEAPDSVFIVYGTGVAEENGKSREDRRTCCRTRSLTYEHVDHASNAVAAWALKLRHQRQNQRPEECVACKRQYKHRSGACGECMRSAPVSAIMMHNSPEYIIILLGLLKAGTSVALIHPQLRGLLLQRAIEAAGAELVVCDDQSVHRMRSTWLQPDTREPLKCVPAPGDENPALEVYPFPLYICGATKPIESAGEHGLVPHLHHMVKDMMTPGEAQHHEGHRAYLQKRLEEECGLSEEQQQHSCQPPGFPVLLEARYHGSLDESPELPEHEAGGAEKQGTSGHPASKGAAGTPAKSETGHDLAETGDVGDQSAGGIYGSASFNIPGGALGLPCCYMYTADSHGRMRATFLSHLRFVSAGLSWQLAVPLSASDRLLVPVQLSQEVGLHALASAIACRGSLLLRSNSSLFGLWMDIESLDSSVLWHTGTMWMGLLKAHEKFCSGTGQDEPQRSLPCQCHPRLRASVGTGLGQELWPVVQRLFKVPRILEFHSLPNLQTGHIFLNSWGVVGSCGFVPNKAMNVRGLERLVAYDEAADQIERDPKTGKGKCAPEDPVTLRRRGELILRVYEGKGLESFRLFAQAAVAQELLYRDVFEDGDMWCRSGDLVERDRAGFFYLYGRIGPNFRLDGEYAPVSEVASFLMRHGGVLEARVEGLRVFHKERAPALGGPEAAVAAAAAANDIAEAQRLWPKTILKLLQAGPGRRRLKALFACIHVRLERAEASKERGGELPRCGPLDLDTCLLVADGFCAGHRNKKQQDAEAQELQRGDTLMTVESFLRGLRHSIEQSMPRHMQPVVLLLCFSECGSGGGKGGAAPLCSACIQDVSDSAQEGESGVQKAADCFCSCGCCCGCGSCGLYRHSIEGLCKIVERREHPQPCNRGGYEGCRGGADNQCMRCCFLFYADQDGDAFVPLTLSNFRNFVEDMYPEFGV